ncbi:uncharacterized protein LOC105829230 isoform X2 [Monomorium pharaonis]|uniref:uncharacterized protein LOC105829230 isoform X2 n=1 Tax=Monomorium pharaonis TaxID=307658 RepID=UPI0017470B52|nr:uncharacterized protein LOC105829230 isoform X2 [Monomorium pharaonis]
MKTVKKISQVDKIELEYGYVFPGCYALQFHTSNIHKSIVGKNFVNTTYQRVEVKEPQVICRSDEYSNVEKRQNFILDVTLPPDTGDKLVIHLFKPQNQNIKQGCAWSKEPVIYDWTVDLGVSTSKKALTDKNCDVKLVRRAKEGYEKFVRCHFQLELPIANYCLFYTLFDDRCEKETTIWKPPYYIDTNIGNKTITCTWVRGCVKSFENWPSVVNVQSRMMKSDKLLSTSSYLLLPIIAIILIVSAVVGILCFWYYWRIRNEEVSLYTNSQHDDSDCLKSIDFGIDEIKKKGISHDNYSCDDIVLLYTNNSTSFMALMKDFRQTLAKMCSCSVHDWHDGAVWNKVAKVGAVLWFTELLNNGCRCIWIDTPATRSVVISNSRNNESSVDELSICYKIHDFRDMAFRVVLEVAKSKVNDVARQYRKHFVVRFEEIEELKIENTINVNDPFLDLSPHARYYIPQHLMQLCSDLSVVKAEI